VDGVKYMQLKEMMKEIRKLVKEKGHGNSLDIINNKFLFAMIEISEAADIWKKHKFNKYYDDIGIQHDPKREIPEELIDAIFYILDAYALMYRDLENVPDPDEMFLTKLKKNLNREYRYGRDE